MTAKFLLCYMLRTMAEEDKHADPSLRKVLSVFDGIAILIGITIGAGIYSIPQIIAGYLGSFDSIIILWLLGIHHQKHVEALGCIPAVQLI